MAVVVAAAAAATALAAMAMQWPALPLMCRASVLPIRTRTPLPTSLGSPRATASQMHQAAGPSGSRTRRRRLLRCEASLPPPRRRPSRRRSRRSRVDQAPRPRLDRARRSLPLTSQTGHRCRASSTVATAAPVRAAAAPVRAAAVGASTTRGGWPRWLRATWTPCSAGCSGWGCPTTRPPSSSTASTARPSAPSQSMTSSMTSV